LEKITLQHLLEQTDGFDSKLPEKCSKENYNKQNETYDMKTFIGCVLDDTIENPIDTPGSKWQFSSFGYVLLGRVIEKLSKMTYEEYVRKNVLEKCNSKDIIIGKNSF
jgi:CubicO group peptidase (beta-lactamase class C family)